MYCGAPGADRVALDGGLTALEDPACTGLIRYPGEALITALVVVTLALVPIAVGVALAGAPSAATVLLLLGFIGLPVVALVDAQRAGAAVQAAAAIVPDLAPGPAWPPAHVAADGGSELVRGRIRRIAGTVSGPVSGDRGLAVRCEVRVGGNAVVLARHLATVEFLVESDSGSSLWVRGTVAVEGREYSATTTATAAHWAVHDAPLLPATFSDGGWLCELLVREGDSVAVFGELSDHALPHPLGAGYRASATIPVVTGRPGAPVRIRVEIAEGDLRAL